MHPTAALLYDGEMDFRKMKLQLNATFLVAFFYASLTSTQVVKAEQDSFRFPLNTPVTCSPPERLKIFRRHSSFFEADEARKYSPEVLTAGNNSSSSWWNKCLELCPQLKPISPGYGWIYDGQYDGMSGAGNCKDTWIKLDRKDGERVTF